MCVQIHKMYKGQRFLSNTRQDKTINVYLHSFFIPYHILMYLFLALQPYLFFIMNRYEIII